MCDGRAGERCKNEVSFEDGQNFDQQRWGMGVTGRGSPPRILSIPGYHHPVCQECKASLPSQFSVLCLRPTTLRNEGTISLKQRAGLLAAYYKSGLGKRGQWWEYQAWYSSAMMQPPPPPRMCNIHLHRSVFLP